MADQKHLEILKQGVSAWNQWREGNPVIDPLLSDADLSRADLTRADLFRANLSHADLTGADLSHADLFDANLSHANLSHANLISADLSRADLSGANFSDAVLHETVFGNTHLSKAKGLETCVHRGPSTIDLRTLQQSWPLPEVFLRGCGLPKDFITYLPSFLNQPIQFYSCFISYGHADKAFARRLHDTLQGRGIRCWLDEHQLLPGDHMHRAVDEAVRLWDKVLLCCSKDSLHSWWVDKELQKALQKEERLFKERGKPVLAIIPLDLDGYMFDPQWTDWKQQHVTERLAANFQGWEKSNKKFDAEFEKVVKALRADDGGRAKPPRSKL